jgi:hypothetical protein
MPECGEFCGDCSQASPPGLGRPGLKPFLNLWKATAPRPATH